MPQSILDFEQRITMLKQKKVDPGKEIDLLLKQLRKWLVPTEYARCVWLLDQREFTRLYVYIVRRSEIAHRVSERVKNEEVPDTLWSAFRHTRRYHCASNNFVASSKAYIAIAKYVWAVFGPETLRKMDNASRLTT